MEYYQENGNYECKAIDLMSYSFPLFNTISKKFSNFTMEKIPFIWSIIYFMFDNKVSSYISGKLTLKMLDNKKLRKDIEMFNPDITISTHFFGNDLITGHFFLFYLMVDDVAGGELALDVVN